MPLGHISNTSMVGVVSRPKESTPAFIDGINSALRENTDGHGVGEEGEKDGVDKNETAPNGRAAITPASEIFITLGDSRSKVRGPEFVSGEGEAVVSLGEGGNRVAESRSHGSDIARRDMNGDEGAFVEINVEAGGFGEGLKNALQSMDMINACANNNKRVIGVLEYRAREVVNKGVGE